MAVTCKQRQVHQLKVSTSVGSTRVVSSATPQSASSDGYND